MKRKSYIAILLAVMILSGCLDVVLDSLNVIDSPTSVYAEKITKKGSKNKANKDKNSKKKKKKDPEYKKINKEMADKRAKATFKQGTYLVGQDLPPGEYVVVIGDKELDGRKGYLRGSYRLYSDSNKTEEVGSGHINQDLKELVEDGVFSKAKFKKSELAEYSSILIEVKEGQLIELNNVKIYPADLRLKQNPNRIVEGYYKIGRDLPKGKYTIKRDGLGGEQLHSVRILNTVDPTVPIESSWIKSYQDYSDETYPDEITLQEDTYIYFSDLIMSKIKTDKSE